MLKDVTAVKPMADYQLWIKFEDGSEGVLSVDKMITFDGVFAPLAEQSFFEQVSVHPELGTIVWPSGADLDPVVLYSAITGQPLPSDKAAS